jgi:glycosyltransferase involved in cell wall biosynthesis
VLTTRLGAAPPAGVRVQRSLSVLVGRGLARVAGQDRVMALHDLATARTLERSPGSFDVVHTWPAAGLRTMRAAARLGVPAVRELPNTHTASAYEAARRAAQDVGLPPDSNGSHAPRLRRLAREILEYSEATALLAPSDVVVRSFLQRGFDPARLLRHRYGYDPRRFRLEDARARPPGGGSLRALFLGRAEPRKGLHLALRAWRASRASEQGTFTVCGAFDPAYRDVLADLLDHPSIQVRSFVDDPSALYAENDVVVLPSLEEGSALVTYEGSAMGCVPLVSDVTGAECVPGSTALVHPAGSWEVLAGHLDLLSSAPDELLTMQRRCLQERDRLSWQAGVAMTEEAYRAARDLLARSAGKAVET